MKGCTLCTAADPVVRLAHFEGIADALFLYAAREQVRGRARVGDVVVATGAPVSWDNIGVVVRDDGDDAFAVWTACGPSRWWNMAPRNYGQALGYEPSPRVIPRGCPDCLVCVGPPYCLERR